MGVFLCPHTLYLWEQISYNVGMKEKEIKIRADEEFVEKVDYLQRINDYKNRSDTIRKTIEKEYNREHMFIPCVRCDYHAIIAEDGRLISKCYSPKECKYVLLKEKEI